MGSCLFLLFFACKACYGFQAVMASLILLLWTQVLVCVHACRSIPLLWYMYVCVLTGFVPALMAFIIVLQYNPWRRRSSSQLIHADRFNHSTLRQLAKALPTVLVRDCVATTVATYSNRMRT